jgi:hypothetical protein
MSGVGSGSIYLDNVFLRRLPDPAAGNWTTLLPFGASWHFSTNNPAGNWFAPGFNDSGWPRGRAKFGAGSGPTNVVTRLPQLLPNYYFRTQFNVADTNIEELLLSATCTDVSVSAFFPLRVFLNGKPIPSFIDAVTMQGNETRYFDLVPYISFLKPGLNTLAVQIGNTWSDYDDVAFDVSLKAVTYRAFVPNLAVRRSADATQLAADTPPGTIWQLQSCDTLSEPNWRILQTFTNTEGAIQTIPAPATGAQAFYRLVPY